MNKQFGICLLSAIPMRETPTEKAEMVNQMLFGEYYKILETQPRWVFIETILDGYRGWMDKKMVSPMDETEMESWHSSMKDVVVTQTSTNLINETDAFSLSLSPGCLIPSNKDTFKLAGKNFRAISTSAHNLTKVSIESLAKSMLGAPYLWGGKTPYGIDCSGFMQVIFRSLINDFPRDASQQAEVGDKEVSFKESIPGDLAFFSDTPEKITHVGLILKDHNIIHASGRVRIDLLDERGIYNKELDEVTHQLRLIRRL